MATAPSILPSSGHSYIDKQSLLTGAISSGLVLAQSGIIRTIALGATPLAAVDITITLVAPIIFGFASGYLADRAIVQRYPYVSSIKRMAYSLATAILLPTAVNVIGGIASHVVSQEHTRGVAFITSMLASCASPSVPVAIILEKTCKADHFYDPFEDEIDSDDESELSKQELDVIDV